MTTTDMNPVKETYWTLRDRTRAWLRGLFPLSLEARIVIGVLAALTGWGALIATFGVPALVFPMTFIVPGLVLGLVLLTWGM